MSWAAGDDEFDIDPDIDTFNIQASALGLFWCSVTYCCRNRNGGFIPQAAVSRLPGGRERKAVDKLVECGWWIKEDDGYMVRSFIKYNPACVGGPISKKRAEAGSKGGKAKAANMQPPVLNGSKPYSKDPSKIGSKSGFATNTDCENLSSYEIENMASADVCSHCETTNIVMGQNHEVCITQSEAETSKSLLANGVANTLATGVANQNSLACAPASPSPLPKESLIVGSTDFGCVEDSGHARELKTAPEIAQNPPIAAATVNAHSPQGFHPFAMSAEELTEAERRQRERLSPTVAAKAARMAAQATQRPFVTQNTPDVASRLSRKFGEAFDARHKSAH